MLDVYILHAPDSAGAAWARGLHERLRARGIHAAWGTDPRPCRVLVHAGPPDDRVARASPGAARLDVSPRATWLAPALSPDQREARIIDCVLSLLELGIPERLTASPHVCRVVDDLAAFVAGLPDDDPLQLINDAIEWGVDRGAPIHNAGSPTGCIAVYEAAIDCVLARLSARPDPSPLLTVMLEELAEVRGQHEDDANARSWTLRNTFDRVLLAYHTSQAMQSVDLLFETLQRAGRVLTPTLLHDVIGLAIARGAPVFNAGGHGGCARVYLRTALGVLELLNPDLSGASRSEQIAHDTLSTLVDRAEERLEAEATELAWDLRTAFDAIIDVAGEERPWKHDA